MPNLEQVQRLYPFQRNQQALSPSEAKDFTLEDGDILEIVKIFAGG